MARDATNTSSDMEAHRAAFDACHLDQMAAQLRGEHWWTIFLRSGRLHGQRQRRR
jgi:hypothetical protein